MHAKIPPLLVKETAFGCAGVLLGCRRLGSMTTNIAKSEEGDDGCGGEFDVSMNDRHSENDTPMETEPESGPGNGELAANPKPPREVSSSSTEAEAEAERIAPNAVENSGDQGPSSNELGSGRPDLLSKKKLDGIMASRSEENVTIPDNLHHPFNGNSERYEVSRHNLTVIDGPLATTKILDECISIAEGTGASSRTDQVRRDHTPTSSMDSSLGELLGESSVILKDDPTPMDAIPTETPEGRDGDIAGNARGQDATKNVTLSKSTLEKISIGRDQDPVAVRSTEAATMELAGEPRKNVVASKSYPNLGSPPEMAATTTGRLGEMEKLPLRHSDSTPTDISASQAGTSLKRGASSPSSPFRPNNNAAPLSHTNYEEDDDDENNIPPDIQSRIAERSPAERYIRFKEKLGSGAYKDVYRAYDTIEGIEVAWNVVKLNGVPKAERVRIVNEVRLLERLHHPNIISFHGSWVNRETERVVFVTEILSSGTLKSFVQKVQLIRWKIFKRWAIQILKVSHSRTSAAIFLLIVFR